MLNDALFQKVSLAGSPSSPITSPFHFMEHSLRYPDSTRNARVDGVAPGRNWQFIFRPRLLHDDPDRRDQQHRHDEPDSLAFSTFSRETKFFNFFFTFSTFCMILNSDFELKTTLCYLSSMFAFYTCGVTTSEQPYRPLK